MGLVKNQRRRIVTYHHTGAEVEAINFHTGAESEEINFLTGPEVSAINFYRMLKVTLKDGTNYAFDITGAQHGYLAPVLPWDEYAQTRSLEILKDNFFGHEQHRTLKIYPFGENLEGTRPGFRAARTIYQRQAATWLTHDVEDFVRQVDNTSLPEILRAAEDVHQKESVELLERVAHRVKDYLGWAESIGWGGPIRP